MASLSDVNPFEESRLDELREILGEEGVQELIAIFIVDSGIHIDALTGALARHDATLLADEAHALKGSSASLGARQLARICSDLETRGRAGTTLGADRDLTELIREFERVTARLASQPAN